MTTIHIEQINDVWQFRMEYLNGDYDVAEASGTAPTLEGIWDLIQEVLSDTEAS